MQRKKVDDFEVMAGISVATNLKDILDKMDGGNAVKVGALILSAIVPPVTTKASVDVSRQARPILNSAFPSASLPACGTT
jgi:hypothetical protein